MSPSWACVHPDIVTCFALHPVVNKHLSLLQQLNNHWRTTIELNATCWTLDLRHDSAENLPQRFDKMWKSVAVRTRCNSNVGVLTRLTSLTSLKIREDTSGVSHETGPFSGNVDLSWLPSLKRLTSLELSSFRCIPRSLPSIQHMDSLESLTLSAMNLSDSDLQWLGNLKSLKHLDLGGCTQIGNGAMASVGDLCNLEQLILYGTKVTHEGVEKLENLHKLQALNLVMCASSVVSGLLRNTHLTQLKFLDLFRVEIEEQDLLKLKAGFPAAQIL